MSLHPSTRNLLLVAAALAGIGVAWVCTHKTHESPQKSLATAPSPSDTGTTDVAVRELMDLAINGGGHATAAAAEKLPDSLNPGDSRILLAFSLGPRPEKLDSASWDVVVNNIWNALRRQKTPPPEFACELMRFFRAPSTGYVLKDYAVQHLGGWLDSGLPEGEGEPDPAMRKVVLAFLVEVAAMHGEGFSGTALYALERAIRPGGADEMSDPMLAAMKTSFVSPLQDAALALVNDKATAPPAQISALQILIAGKDLRGLHSARRIAVDSSAPPMLRASAIACIGALGAGADLALLNAIAMGCTDDRLLAALRPALERISKNEPPAGS